MTDATDQQTSVAYLARLMVIRTGGGAQILQDYTLKTSTATITNSICEDEERLSHAVSLSDTDQYVSVGNQYSCSNTCVSLTMTQTKLRVVSTLVCTLRINTTSVQRFVLFL